MSDDMPELPKLILTPDEREARRKAAINAIRTGAQEAVELLYTGEILRDTFPDLIAANARTSILLQAEHARRLAGIPITPQQCLEYLKEHARAQVRLGKPVEFVTGEGTTIRASLSYGDTWLAYRSGGANAWERKESTEDLLHEIDTAAMVAI